MWLLVIMTAALHNSKLQNSRSILHLYGYYIRLHTDSDSRCHLNANIIIILCESFIHTFRKRWTFLTAIQGFLILVQELYSDYIDTTLRETTQHHLHNTYKQHLQLPSWVIRQEAEVNTQIHSHIMFRATKHDYEIGYQCGWKKKEREMRNGMNETEKPSCSCVRWVIYISTQLQQENHKQGMMTRWVMREKERVRG